MVYPVDGDSAIAEILLNEEPAATIWLEGLDLEARGAERTRSARFVIDLGDGPVELLPFLDQLEAARIRLLENEHGREPDSYWNDDG